MEIALNLNCAMRMMSFIETKTKRMKKITDR